MHLECVALFHVWRNQCGYEWGCVEWGGGGLYVPYQWYGGSSLGWRTRSGSSGWRRAHPVSWWPFLVGPADYSWYCCVNCTALWDCALVPMWLGPPVTLCMTLWFRLWFVLRGERRAGGRAFFWTTDLQIIHFLFIFVLNIYTIFKDSRNKDIMSQEYFNGCVYMRYIW